MKKLFPGRLLVASLATYFLAGCAVGPNFERPATDPPASFVSEPLPAQTAAAPIRGGAAQHFVAGAEVPARWWTLFGSAELDAWIDRALESSPTIRSAKAALRVAEETALAQRGALWPSVLGGFNSSRQRVAQELASPLSSNNNVFTLHTAQLAISYVFDLFGGNRRALESAQAQAESQRYQVEAAILTLGSNIALAAIQEASLRAQIAATREIIRIDEEQLALTRRQLELGAVPRINLVAQEAVLAQAQALLPPLQKQLAQARNNLVALAGRLPGEGRAPTFDLAALNLPVELPLSLPSRLVERRPDVRAAEAQVHAASAQVGVAIANMLPQLTLTAGGGYSGTEFRQLGDPASLMWNAAAGLVQPIFAGGTLLHRKRAAEAAYDQAAALYRGVVVTAFQNVADALGALAADAEALRATAAAEQATLASLQMTRKQVELGDINYVALLAAQQAYQQAVLNRVQAQAARYADTVALFQALGGGW
jgi:NodT family efflux transporter outer membrane factor (OMF) lipoprotein